MTNGQTLTVGAYIVPNDCKAFVRAGKVIVSYKRNAVQKQRCRDCRHCVMGKSKYNQHYARPVCKLQPKTNRGYANPEIIEQPRYYAVRECDTVCEKYEPRTNETK